MQASGQKDGTRWSPRGGRGQGIAHLLVKGFHLEVMHINSVHVFLAIATHRAMAHFKSHVYSVARAAIMKYHQQSDTNNRNLLSHSYGGQKFEIKVLAGPCSL